ncbi:MAG: hypothetical protein U0229_22410 [Anaeromyxobacter sp.]
MNLRPASLALLAVLATPAGAIERVAVISVADPPGPDADLAEITHQLRAACRDRVGNVDDVPAMRARLLGDAGPASLAELDRAYGGALATYQNGEFESAVRTLRAIVEDLEKVPEGPEAYSQWVRANLRLAHAAGSVGLDPVVEEAMDKLIRTEPALEPEPDQYSPAYRRKYEAARKRVRALPRHKLLLEARGGPGTLYLNGRRMGTVGPAPLELDLPAGSYRVGAAAGALRVPTFSVELTENRKALLDFTLAEAVRPNAGPGLALAAADRPTGLIRAGAWLGVDKLLTVTRVQESGVQFLVGAIHDVRRGAMLREGQVRIVAGGVPAVSLGALASFLLTGQQARGVEERAPQAQTSAQLSAPAPPPAATKPPASAGPAPAVPLPPPPAVAAAKPPGPPTAPPSAAAAQPATKPAAAAPRPAPAREALAPAPPKVTDLPRSALDEPARTPRRWSRPSVVVSGLAAALCAGVAVQQAVASSSARDEANAMVGSGGTLLPGSDPVRHRDLVDRADASARNAWIAGGVSAALAVTTVVLGLRPVEQPPGAIALRF